MYRKVYAQILVLTVLLSTLYISSTLVYSTLLHISTTKLPFEDFKYTLIYEGVTNDIYVVRYKPYYIYHGKYVDVEVYLGDRASAVWDFIAYLAWKYNRNSSLGCADPDYLAKHRHECLLKKAEFEFKVKSLNDIDNLTKLLPRYRDLILSLMKMNGMGYQRKLFFAGPYMGIFMVVYEDEFNAYRDKLIAFAKDVKELLRDYNVTHIVIAVFRDAAKVHHFFIYNKDKHLLEFYGRVYCSIFQKVVKSREYEHIIEKYGLLKYYGYGYDILSPRLTLFWGRVEERGYPPRNAVEELAKLVASIADNSSTIQTLLNKVRELGIINVSRYRPILSIVFSQLSAPPTALAPISKMGTATAWTPQQLVENRSAIDKTGTAQQSKEFIDYRTALLVTVPIIIASITIVLIGYRKH